MLLKFNCISSLSCFLESPPQSQFLGAEGIKNEISNKVKYTRIMATILHCQNPSACSTNLNLAIYFYTIYLFYHQVANALQPINCLVVVFQVLSCAFFLVGGKYFQ